MVTFADAGTEDIYNGRSSKASRKVCPASLLQAARRKLFQVASVDQLDQIRIPPGNRLEALHGEQVGVAALVMARLQSAVLARTAPRLRPIGITHASVISHFGPERGAAVWEDVRTKQVDLAAVNGRLATHWPAFRARLAAIVKPPEELAAVLTSAGAPTTPTQLGFSEALFAEAFTHARELRDRYTFLDFAADLEP